MDSGARALSFLAAAGLVAVAWNCGSESADEWGDERAFSAQLHVHGSFSEHIGSLDSHSYEASELGVDVVWWSDHDFRATSYRQPARFSFDAEEEPCEVDERSDALGRAGTKGLRSLSPPASHTLDTKTVLEGAASLRVTPDSGLVQVRADRDGLRRPLAAEVTLRLAVRPDGGRPLVDIGLSEHAPREGLGLEPYSLRYFAAEDGAEPYRQGATYYVPLVLRSGEWNELALPVTRDAVAGFPFARGEDNGLAHVVLGVEGGSGPGAANFDALALEQELAGAALFERQRELIDEVAGDYPGLTQHQGVEISYATLHLNEFSLDTQLLDYDALAQEVRAELGPEVERGRMELYLTRRAVEEVHARGGLVSYNHMFGTATEGAASQTTRRGVLDSLTGERLFGVDLLEVGYRDRGGHDLADHLWVWDRLARRGLFPVGVGVSDSHGGPEGRWRTSPNNFVSWIFAASPARADLLAGLRAGRVFFGDIVLFDGTLDLVTARGHRMGQIVVTAATEARVTVRLEGGRAGHSVHVIESGERAATYAVEGERFEHAHTVALDPDRSGLVRIEVYDRGGRAVVFSNPIHFVRAEPDEPGCAARVVRDG